MIPWRIERFDTLHSTSDLCVARARAGEAAGLVVAARQQIGGRGRAGRSWVSPPGNLYVSVMLRPATAAAQSGLWSLLAGLALAEAVQGFLPAGIRATLKWPNDVMIGAGKLGGVLIDAAIEQNRVSWLVIGLGANLAAAPDVPGRAVTSLAAHGAAARPDVVIMVLLARIDHWASTIEAGEGASLRAAWLARAHPPGSPISVDGGRITGAFAGLTADGALILIRGEATEIIRAGEVAMA